MTTTTSRLNIRPRRPRRASCASRPTKARRVIDLVRGKSVAEALDILRWAPQAASEPVAKVIASAAANAQNNDGLDPATLVVATIYADEGPTAKRIRPRAQGRAFRIRKRTSHITVIVESRPAKERGAQGSLPPASATRASRPGQQGSRHGARQEGTRQEGARQKAAPETALRLLTRREARSSGPEDQSPRLPPRHHHRLEVPLVRRQAVRGLRQGRRRDPSSAVRAVRHPR